MALIREQLSKVDQLGRIDFVRYVKDLTAHLVRSGASRSSTVHVKTDVDPLFFGIDVAVPCGLLLNELISNALKHAFPQGRKGEVHVALHAGADGSTSVTVRDNGVGFPSDLEIQSATSVGLGLVKTLTDQLRGVLEMSRNGGTTFTLTFRAQTPSGKDTYGG
jgi:two-component sensor histidine kinase